MSRKEERRIKNEKKKSGGPAMPPREALLLLSFVPIILAKIGNNYYLLQNRMIENDLVGSAWLLFVLLTRVASQLVRE